jgi:chromosome segregation ATPase
MDTRTGSYSIYLLPLGGCLLFAFGWLLGGGMAVTRGEPGRAESRATSAEIAKLKKQLVNLQSQQSRLARELDEAQTSRRKLRDLEDELATLRSDLTKLKKESRNPLNGPIGVIKDIANAVSATPTPEPSPTPESEQ